MARVKRGNVARKRRKKILKRAKGFRGSLSKLYRLAKPAVFHALENSYKDRRARKRSFRRLWITRINAAVAAEGVSYSRFINLTKQKNVAINRKILSELAYTEPKVFNDILTFVK